jgi:amidase
LGLVSRSGIIPLAHSQDTAGPMGRTVRDAALLLTAMTGTDPDDAETSKAETHHDYSANLTADALSGRRIGIIRSWSGAGSNPDVEAIFQASIEALQEAGAILVDDINIDVGEMYDAEYEVLLYEFRSDLNAYLKAADAPVQSLSDLIAYNEANRESVMPWFGQEIFLEADAKGPLTDDAYLAALETSKRISQSSINNIMDEHELDALIAPTNGPARPIDLINGDASGIGSSSLAAVSGYPSITVPAGFVSGMPVGLSFIGKAWNEKQLIEIAYAFEQTTRIRKPPDL